MAIPFSWRGRDAKPPPLRQEAAHPPRAPGSGIGSPSTIRAWSSREPRQLVELDPARLVGGHRRHAAGQLVLAVDLEHALGEPVELAVLLQEPLEPQVEPVLLGHQARRCP